MGARPAAPPNRSSRLSHFLRLEPGGQFCRLARHGASWGGLSSARRRVAAHYQDIVEIGIGREPALQAKSKLLKRKISHAALLFPYSFNQLGLFESSAATRARWS